MFVAANALSLGTGVHFAVAPNGRTVALGGNYGGSRVLLRRDLDRLDPEPIVGTEGASDVFFSHDGRHLGFETRSELWTVSLDGSTPRRLAPNQPLRGGTWGPEDTIVVGRVGSGLWAASSSAGKPRQLTVPAAGERHELPHMLPGGRAVLFTILPSNGPPQVAVHLLESGETRSLFEGVGGRFVDSGHLVFGRQGSSGRSRSIPARSRHSERPVRCVTTSCGRQRGTRSSRWVAACSRTCAPPTRSAGRETRC
jgi:hypothetical protein